MGLDHSLVGVPSEPQVRSWDSKDALLYAVGVGAGLGDPLTVSIWRQDGSDTALFQTTRHDGTVVIDRGRLQVREL